MPISPPSLPFPEFKWRWASFQPTEGLNARPVYLGVLRALNECDGELPSSGRLYRALERVQTEAFQGRTRRIELARSNDRNLIRNSGQYWKALGLLEETPGIIRLTPEGKQLATGILTPNEFADRTVRDLALPNSRIQSAQETAPWQAHNLTIHPLKLILRTLLSLREKTDDRPVRMSVGELVGVVIPASGASWTPQAIADAILELRRGGLDIQRWPDVVPNANDERMATEFLIFLNEYGYLELEPAQSRRDRIYRLKEQMVARTQLICDLPASPIGTSFPIPPDLFVPRGTRTTITRNRPGQSGFRESVRLRWNSRCALTGESTVEALIAAHIIPVEEDGNDDPDNGILLRADVHILFDEQLIRIDPEGAVHKHQRIVDAPSYAGLATSIRMTEARHRYVDWRWRYL